jgi:hypothetical protein
VICGDVVGDSVREIKSHTMLCFSNRVLIHFVEIDELYDQRRFFRLILMKLNFLRIHRSFSYFADLISLFKFKDKFIVLV